MTDQIVGHSHSAVGDMSQYGAGDGQRPPAALDSDQDLSPADFGAAAAQVVAVAPAAAAAGADCLGGWPDWRRLERLEGLPHP